MLQQLGPTYVKIGQMAASQGASLPPEWAEELARLQSDVAPFPYEKAREIITRQLGKPPEELFATFEQEPFAAASTAQVHRATLADGHEVAVKVQRPDIVAMTKADLGVMQEISSVAERRFELARRLDLHGDRQRVRLGRPARARLPQRGVPGPPARRRHGQVPERRRARGPRDL